MPTTPATVDVDAVEAAARRLARATTPEEKASLLQNLVEGLDRLRPVCAARDKRARALDEHNANKTVPEVEKAAELAAVDAERRLLLIANPRLSNRTLIPRISEKLGILPSRVRGYIEKISGKHTVRHVRCRARYPSRVDP